ncbi:hypothetical protein QNH23_13885 [Siminovitchia fortis]|uniref:Uracil DNA glycosylase superfamily protein n=1 Tax=Siminovitchia fortis TaxID=254758 RepID=A0A443IVL8_9BACI|nr:hypothetical protein [Siminovitchia fortis]RWR12179.1 hypothetical protein D4N35_007360 [Siminovitchia fortis]WHY80984.1 hypothetical protein QNH23_13885 [Siminovitchia fortis]
MFFLNTDFQRFLPSIRNLPDSDLLEKKDLLNEHFLIGKADGLEVYYAPHNEFINCHAEIVIVGITPGWTQMEAAFRQAKLSLQKGDSLEQVLLESKRAASFTGAMRKNLIEMLDECGVNTAFSLSSSRLLFGECRRLLHTTSIIKYPVFIEGKNYTGHAPKIHQSALLTHYAHNVFPKELHEIETDFLLVPLGKVVSEVMTDLVYKGMIPEKRCLFGFPHPSGANGHRKKQFHKAKAELKAIVERFVDERELF